MASCRLFLSQQALDTWVSDGRAVIDGEELLDKKSGTRFRLITGVLFLSEVSGNPDGSSLVGKVKDIEQLEGLKAEHLHDSVVLGENAYLVQEGFVGTPLVQQATNAPKPKPRAQTIASLQAFFLNNVK